VSKGCEVELSSEFSVMHRHPDGRSSCHQRG
jgi:hypothetical protein